MAEYTQPDRRRVLTGAAALGALAAASPALSAPQPAARYRVTMLAASPPRFSVHAELPAEGDELAMAGSWPAELPEMAAKGWPALVSDLKVTDAAGRALTPTLGRNHWKLDRPTGGRITLDYVIDLGLFAAAAWSSPLESGIVEAKNGEEGDMAVHARSLFIDAGINVPAEVAFVVPAPWRPVAPWSRDFRGRYLAPTTADLRDNMLAFTTRPPLIARASGFTVQIVAMGHWRPLEALLKTSLERIVTAETRLMGWRGRETYNVVLVPVTDTGGESYRQSFAYCFDGPTADNRAQWANTLAHELFHYWNASRLKGADYPSSQWFQEGFTEYAANLVALSGAIAPPQAFLAKLSGHIANAARLETTMENIGNRKGPPLYSSGALVAFSWDVAIRNASGGRRNLGHFFRNLWRATNGGEQPYAWPDIRLALEATAPGDWEGFHSRHIAGRDPLPLDGTLAKAGLRRVGTDIQIDADAPAQANVVWRSMVAG